MLAYAVKRMLLALPALFGVTVLTYLIISLAPGDAASILVDPKISKADQAQVRLSLGLDQPIAIRYGKWLGGVLRGDLGNSFTTRQPVVQRIRERMGPTVGLSLTAAALAYLIGVPIGVIAATRQYSTFDTISSIIAYIGVSIPTFFFGMILISLFALKLDWLPVTGMRTLGAPESFTDLLKHLLLPAVVLCAGTLAAVTRYTRAAMLETIHQDYLRTARAKGLGERLVIYKHGLRNALIPVITLLGLQLPGLVGGALITEQIFRWPGMGLLTLEAVSGRDYPVLMGLNLLAAMLVQAGALLTDLLYALADPRVRYL